MRFELFGRFKSRKHPESHKIQPQSVQEHSSHSENIENTPVTPQAVETNTEFHEANKINTLKSQGYDYNEIDKQLNTNLKEAVLNEHQLPSDNNTDDTLFYHEDFTQGLNSGDENSISTNSATRFGTPKEDLRPLTYEVEQQTSEEDESSEEYELFMEEVEEIVDSILSKKYTKFEDLKNELSSQITEINERLDQFENTIDELNTKIKELESNTIKKLNLLKTQQEAMIPQIEGIEKAFKDIIPNIVDSIKELQESRELEHHNNKPESQDKLDNILQEDLRQIKNSQKPNHQKKVIVNEEKNKSEEKKEETKKSKNNKTEVLEDFDYTELIN